MEEQFTMFWNHPKIVGVTYWGYIVGRTWVNGSGLINADGTERPALTWLIDFVKNNPDPPNDFPGLVPGGDVRIRIPKEFFVVTPYRPFSGPDRNRMELFDLQGRMTGIFSVDRKEAFVSCISVPGIHVIRRNGQCKGICNTIR